VAAEATRRPEDRTLTDPLSPRSLPLWAGVLVPPAAWGIHLVLGDLIFELGCGPAVRGGSILGLGLETWALIQTLVLAGVTVLAGALAWRAWRELRGRSDGVSLLRAQALAVAGMASSLLYLAIIAYGFLTPFYLHPCLPVR
jgi:cation transport ATPase